MHTTQRTRHRRTHTTQDTEHNISQHSTCAWSGPHHLITHALGLVHNMTHFSATLLHTLHPFPWAKYVAAPAGTLQAQACQAPLDDSLSSRLPTRPRGGLVFRATKQAAHSPGPGPRSQSQARSAAWDQDRPSQVFTRIRDKFFQSAPVNSSQLGRRLALTGRWFWLTGR